MEKQRKAGPLYQENNIQIDVDVNKDTWCCQNSEIQKQRLLLNNLIKKKLLPAH